jgi:hypothetical protein
MNKVTSALSVDLAPKRLKLSSAANCNGLGLSSVVVMVIARLGFCSLGLPRKQNAVYAANERGCRGTEDVRYESSSEISLANTAISTNTHKPGSIKDNNSNTQSKTSFGTMPRRMSKNSLKLMKPINANTMQKIMPMITSHAI